MYFEERGVQPGDGEREATVDVNWWMLTNLVIHDYFCCLMVQIEMEVCFRLTWKKGKKDQLVKDIFCNIYVANNSFLFNGWRA